MNQIARRRIMSAASLSWALAAFVSLSSVCAPAMPAQTPPAGPPPADTTRAPLIGGMANVPADPLRGNPATMSSLGSQARTMQDGFERNHRTGLRFYNGGADASCEVPLGRICYWNNNGDVPPPAERNDAKIEREQLLDLLAQAQAADPKDDWVNGMRVRYAIESEQRDVAIRAARACKGTPWWCEALEGLALHNANQHTDATAAFARALAAMPVAQQCAWTDLTWWLDPSTHVAYTATPCASRSAENMRVMRLAQPLWMIPSNDIQNELYARRTMSRVHSLARIPYDLQWGDDLLESQIRYGGRSSATLGDWSRADAQLRLHANGRGDRQAVVRHPWRLGSETPEGAHALCAALRDRLRRAAESIRALSARRHHDRSGRLSPHARARDGARAVHGRAHARCLRWA